jgi:outer membrane protein TolC
LTEFRHGACFLAIVLAAGLGGCAHIKTAPLADKPDLAASLAALKIERAQVPLPELAAHPFDLSRPLDSDEVAAIAVVNNPDLKAARTALGVARAQAFAAGLLPNPTFTFTYGKLLAGAPANAVSTGLAEDILPLLTLSARKREAAAKERGVRLNLLWQEWQVVAKARSLFVQAVELGRERAVLEENRRLFADRYRRSSEAMQQGNATLTVAVSDLAALQTVETQLHALDQQILKVRHDLDALLGLLPDANLRLQHKIAVPPLDGARIRAMLPQLLPRRPDLLALKAGYEAQQEKLRQAIIEQFPPLSIGGTWTKDTTPVYTIGPNLTIGLPIFNHGQGQVAIARATRRQLRAQYTAQLDTALGAAGRLVSEEQQIEAQYRANQQSLGRLRQAAATADAAFAAGNLDERGYVDLHASLLEKELEAIKLQETMLELRASLQILVGSALPMRGK